MWWGDSDPWWVMTCCALNERREELYGKYMARVNGETTCCKGWDVIRVIVIRGGDDKRRVGV